MKNLLMICVIAISFSACTSTDNSEPTDATQEEERPSGLPGAGGQFSVAFYNVENLFDPIDHPDYLDDDFSPEGKYQWGQREYQTKLDNLARVISGLGDSNGPELLGLAEVENRKVLEDLVAQRRLTQQYAIVHAEASDLRGIDLALLYSPDIFQYESHFQKPVHLDSEPGFLYRETLVVKGKIMGQRTFILINHWPSRREGQAQTDRRRLKAAKVVRACVDSLQQAEPKAAILVMGDFNDDPSDYSISQGLKAVETVKGLKKNTLYNPMRNLHDPEQLGTSTYRGTWHFFDQIILSASLVKGRHMLRYIEGSAEVYRPSFIRVGGSGRAKDMPRRAIYRGKFQSNGFSDHFPIYVQLRY